MEGKEQRGERIGGGWLQQQVDFGGEQAKEADFDAKNLRRFEEPGRYWFMSSRESNRARDGWASAEM